MIIKLGLYDDHDIVRAGFRQILSGHSDIEIDLVRRIYTER